MRTHEAKRKTYQLLILYSNVTLCIYIHKKQCSRKLLNYFLYFHTKTNHMENTLSS